MSSDDRSPKDYSTQRPLSNDIFIASPTHHRLRPPTRRMSLPTDSLKRAPPRRIPFRAFSASEAATYCRHNTATTLPRPLLRLDAPTTRHENRQTHRLTLVRGTSLRSRPGSGAASPMRNATTGYEVSMELRQREPRPSSPDTRMKREGAEQITNVTTTPKTNIESTGVVEETDTVDAEEAPTVVHETRANAEKHEVGRNEGMEETPHRGERETPKGTGGVVNESPRPTRPHAASHAPPRRRPTQSVRAATERAKRRGAASAAPHTRQPGGLFPGARKMEDTNPVTRRMRLLVLGGAALLALGGALWMRRRGTPRAQTPILNGGRANVQSLAQLASATTARITQSKVDAAREKDLAKHTMKRIREATIQELLDEAQRMREYFQRGY